MSDETYSVYEAKARLSRILQDVRGGRRAVITHRGQPIAAIVPFTEDEEDLETRLDRLGRAGVIELADGGQHPPQVAFLARREGALERFLKDRE